MSNAAVLRTVRSVSRRFRIGTPIAESLRNVLAPKACIEHREVSQPAMEVRMTSQQIIQVDGVRRANDDGRIRENDENDDRPGSESADTRVLPRTPEPNGAERESTTADLSQQDSAPANERWGRIQAAFVDDPRKAVSEAHELVGELTQRIVDAYARERGDLERQWSEGENVSTEDLRVCLQRYRAFFSRLLPSVNKLDID